jgi:hypothetical protein
VALTRPIRMPEVRPAAAGGVGTASIDSVGHSRIAVRCAGCGTRFEGPMFVAMSLAVLVLLSLVLSMVPSRGFAARVRKSRLPAPAALPAAA